MPPAADLTVRDGLRLFSPAAALVKVPEAFFSPASDRVTGRARQHLGCIRSAAALARWRAFRRCRTDWPALFAASVGAEVADEIIATMKAAEHNVRETDPFAQQQTFGSLRAP